MWGFKVVCCSLLIVDAAHAWSLRQRRGQNDADVHETRKQQLLSSGRGASTALHSGRLHDDPADTKEGVHDKPTTTAFVDPLGVGDVADKKVDEVYDAGSDTRRELRKVAASDELQDSVVEDMGRLWKEFMPGWRANLRVIYMGVACAGLGFMWFFIFLSKIYRLDDMRNMSEEDRALIYQVHGDETDPTDTVELDDKQIIEPAEKRMAMHKTDMIIVFHHPEFKYPDKEKKVDPNALKSVLMKRGVFKSLEHQTGLDKLFTPRAHGQDGSSQGRRKSWYSGFQRESRWATSDDPSMPGETATRPNLALSRTYTAKLEREEDQAKESGLPQEFDDSDADADLTNYGDVRQGFLQELHAMFLKRGFDVMVFSSVDSDELFMCISLSNEVAEHYSLLNNTRLQIRHEVVSAMGIAQPEEEIASSPPFMRFDPSLVNCMARNSLIPSNDKFKLYSTIHEGKVGHQMVHSRHRIRIIYEVITKHFDPDLAKHNGFFVDWTPVHNKQVLFELYVIWGRARKLFDFTFVQPISLVHDYFGSRVAFQMAWNGLICKCLTALLPVTIFFELVVVFETYYYGVRNVDNRQILGPSLVLVVWSRMVHNLWEREEDFFACQWDMDMKTDEQFIRPAFHGSGPPIKADIDHNIKEVHYPKAFQIARLTFSIIITLIMSGIVATVICTWIYIFDGELNVVQSVCLSIIIKVCDFTFSVIATGLTDWENHKYQAHHYNSQLWKQFLFQAVSNYSGFVYIAIWQPFSQAGCPPNGCLSILRGRLILMQITLSGCVFAQEIAYAVIVRLTIWMELSKLAKKVETKHVTHSFLEEQAKYVEYRTQEQIDAMCQLCISLGFVLIFGAVAPAMVPIALTVFVAMLRMNALMLTTYRRRPIPRKMPGIGAWKGIVQVLMHIGLLSNAILLVSFGQFFKGAQTLAQLTGIILFCITGTVLWNVVDIMLPSDANETRLLLGRRKHVQKSIERIYFEDKVSLQSGRPWTLKGDGNEAKRLIKHKDWSNIPGLSAEDEDSDADQTPPSDRSPPESEVRS